MLTPSIYMPNYRDQDNQASAISFDNMRLLINNVRNKMQAFPEELEPKELIDNVVKILIQLECAPNDYPLQLLLMVEDAIPKIDKSSPRYRDAVISIVTTAWRMGLPLDFIHQRAGAETGTFTSQLEQDLSTLIPDRKQARPVRGDSDALHLTTVKILPQANNDALWAHMSGADDSVPLLERMQGADTTDTSHSQHKGSFHESSLCHSNESLETGPVPICDLTSSHFPVEDTEEMEVEYLNHCMAEGTGQQRLWPEAAISKRESDLFQLWEKDSTCHPFFHALNAADGFGYLRDNSEGPQDANDIYKLVEPTRVKDQVKLLELVARNQATFPVHVIENSEESFMTAVIKLLGWSGQNAIWADVLMRQLMLAPSGALLHDLFGQHAMSTAKTDLLDLGFYSEQPPGSICPALIMVTERSFNCKIYMAAVEENELVFKPLTNVMASDGNRQAVTLLPQYPIIVSAQLGLPLKVAKQAGLQFNTQLSALQCRQPTEGLELQEEGALLRFHFDYLLGTHGRPKHFGAEAIPPPRPLQRVLSSELWADGRHSNLWEEGSSVDRRYERAIRPATQDRKYHCVAIMAPTDPTKSAKQESILRHTETRHHHTPSLSNLPFHDSIWLLVHQRKSKHKSAFQAQSKHLAKLKSARLAGETFIVSEIVTLIRRQQEQPYDSCVTLNRGYEPDPQYPGHNRPATLERLTPMQLAFQAGQRLKAQLSEWRQGKVPYKNIRPSAACFESNANVPDDPNISSLRTHCDIAEENNWVGNLNEHTEFKLADADKKRVMQQLKTAVPLYVPVYTSTETAHRAEPKGGTELNGSMAEAHEGANVRNHQMQSPGPAMMPITTGTTTQDGQADLLSRSRAFAFEQDHCQPIELTPEVMASKAAYSKMIRAYSSPLGDQQLSSAHAEDLQLAGRHLECIMASQHLDKRHLAQLPPTFLNPAVVDDFNKNFELDWSQTHKTVFGDLATQPTALHVLRELLKASPTRWSGNGTPNIVTYGDIARRICSHVEPHLRFHALRKYRNSLGDFAKIKTFLETTLETIQEYAPEAYNLLYGPYPGKTRVCLPFALFATCIEPL